MPLWNECLVDREKSTGREMTGIEKSLMSRIVKVVYRELESAWAHICPIAVEQVSLETNPQFVQIVPPGETVIVISFQLKLLQSTGLMTLCYPYVALENLINKLSGQNWIDATKKKTDGKETAINRENLLSLTVPLRVELAQTEVRIRDFINMQVGDVVTTEQKINQDIIGYINNRKKYSGRPGLSGKKKGFMITNVYSELGKE